MAIKTAIQAGKTEGKAPGLSAIDRVQRDATVDLPIPEAPQPDTLPVEQTPLAASLAAQGFDIQPPAPPPEVVQAELAAGVDLAREEEQPALMTAAQETQRARERTQPLSQRAKLRSEHMDAGKATFDRAANVSAVLDKKRTDVPTIPTDARQLGSLAPDSLSPSRLLLDPGVLDAGEFDVANNERINPLFGAVMGMVTENWLRNSGFQDGKEIEGDVFIDGDTDAVQQVPNPEESPLSKSKQNARLGDQIWQEWMREKAQLDGLPTDQYLLERKKPGNAELQAIGGLAKEAYWAGNQDIVDRSEQNGQTVYTIKPDQHAKLTNGYKALSKPFESEEIPPLLHPPAQGQPEFEASRRARPATTKTGIRDAGKRIAEAKRNLSQMKRLQDSGREKIFYSMAVEGIVEGFQAIEQAVIPDPNYVGTGNPPLTFDVDALPPADQDSIFAAHYKVGVKRARALVKKKESAIKDATLALEEAATPELRASAQADLDAAHAFSPAHTYKQDMLKLIESLQTSGRYANQVLYGTYSTQMLTGRLGMQQNKWNPQGNTFLRFVAGGPNKVRINPKEDGNAVRAFKEIIATHFLTSNTDADLKPHARIQAFYDWRMGKPTQFRRATFQGKVTYDAAVAAGNALLDWSNGIDGAQLGGLREQLAGVQVDSAAPLSQAVEPLTQIQGAPIPEAAMEVLNKLGAKEAPYVADWLIALAQFDKGDVFYTATEGEIDGITHGISSNAMALGLKDMALRAGAINPDPDLKLMPLEDDGVAGDLRDAMREYITEAAPELAESFVQQLDGEADAQALVELAMAAVQDRDNYLKKSPMTLGYGQAVESLKQHVRTTMTTGGQFQEISDIIENNNLNRDDVLNFLHTALVNSIGQQLNERVLRVGEQLKGINALATMSSKVLYYDNGMGFRSNITSMENLPADDPDAPKPSKHTIKSRDGKRVMNVKTTVFKEVPSGSAIRDYGGGQQIPGAWGSGRSIPTMAQTYDGTMISGVASGTTHERLKKTLEGQGYELSYQPIFDAYKADLATLGVLRDAANREWVKGIKENDYVGQLLGPGGWFDNTMKEVRQELMNTQGDIDLVGDPKWKGLNYILNQGGAPSVVKTLASTEAVAADRGIIVDFEEEYPFHKVAQAIEARAGLKRTWQGGKPQPLESLTPQQALRYIEEFFQTLKVQQYNHKLAADVKRDRAELFKELTAEGSLQVDY